MKLIKTEDAVGHVLCHDMTRIIRDKEKGVAFHKGHVVTEADIEALLAMGKENLYVWEKDESMLHENEAAEILRDICMNSFMTATKPKEGKIELIAEQDGVFVINTKLLTKINSLGEMMIASRRNYFPVKSGDKLAATRVIPLVIEKEKMERAKKTATGETLFEIKPYVFKKVGIVTTGSEVFKGRIKDTFGPVVMDKVLEFPSKIMGQKIVDDDNVQITKAILEFIADGADMVICTGGMSVDPDDKTPLAIKNTGAEIISYGAPVLPGAMFLISYYNGKIPVLGLPGCVMYAKRTIFDLALPRLMADIRIKKEDLAVMGEGGLCLNCDVCVFPNCGFGK